MKSFTVLTLNVWGLPLGISSDKQKRIEAIGQALVGTEADIVCLQELWTKHDFKVLKALLKITYPYHHFFYSGLIGSGLCVFSKWPIEETFYYQFPVNGLFHMIHHGDWFGGKGVGLVHINIKGLRVNVYITHLHADYSEEGGRDHYFTHRLVQAFDTALFIRHTSAKADVSILAGDLNAVSNDPGIRLIRALADLEDAWELAERKELAAETNDCFRNTYRQKALPSTFPGKRIDYILFKGSKYLTLTVPQCIFPLQDRIPGTKISYSDHEAVAAKFCYTELNELGSQMRDSRRTNIMKETRDSLLENLEFSLELCRTEIKGYLRDIHKYSTIIMLIFIGIGMSTFFTSDHNIHKAAFGAGGILTCFQIVLITTRCHDMAWLTNVKKRLKIYVKAVKNNLSNFV